MKLRFFAYTVLVPVCLTLGNFFYQKNFTITNKTEVKVLDSLIDVGSVRYGAEAKAHFRIKNVGTKVLKISKIKPDCFCTIPRLFKNEISPGEVAVIAVNYDSTREGYFNSTVSFNLNTERQSYLLILRGFVRPQSETTALNLSESIK